MTIPRNILSELPRIGPSENPSKYPEEVLPRYIPRRFQTDCWSSEFRRKFPRKFRGKMNFRGVISEELFPRTYFVDTDYESVCLLLQSVVLLELAEIHDDDCFLPSNWNAEPLGSCSVLGISIDTLVETSTDYSNGVSIDALGQALMRRLNMLTKLPRSALALL
ncbi:hypothetical protein F2Q68_00020648 [Brassica cretica]|uniref:Uncharacterized protein n=1 Tax=Brassica cretica TaxID=69181 RepID=A0A8S9FSI0_BRACR|nr:hypothetical protein F2Q68_00020648 [Brassica cretica]